MQNHCAMKFYRIIPWVCLLWAGQVGAQVLNDDCAGALSQGIGLLPSHSTSCDLILPMGYLIVDSTDQAQVNFPYPASPVLCSGFSTAVVAPGKDRWYAVRVNCELMYTVQCSDTCNLSIWSGSDCAMLQPLACHTILPNTPSMGSAIPTTVLPSEDTLLLQISSQGPGRDIAYRMCLTDPFPPCLSIAMTWNDPTPVICFEYDVQITPATSASSADGIAAVHMLAGNAPFAILWDDGDTSFIRSDLSPGVHGFTISDGSICQEEDTIEVAVSLSTGFLEGVSSGQFSLTYDALSGTLLASTGIMDKGTITVYDVLGRIEQQIDIHANEQRIDLSALPKAAHFLVWRACCFMISKTLVIQ